MQLTRRDFMSGATAFGAAAGLGGCRHFSHGGGTPQATRGVVVTARNLSGAFDWPRLAHEAGLTTVATHIGPKDVLPFMKGDQGKRFTDDCAKYGIAVEHELHALEYLLPRDLYAKTPELFRMNEKGERVNDSNACVTNPQTLEVIADKAVEVARTCRSSTGRYYYWFSDNGPTCQCSKCREFSPAEQGVIVENVIVRALRAEIDPKATLSHLAYLNTAGVPAKVKPSSALFLEYAPFDRWHRTTRRDDLVEGGKYLSQLDALLKVFPSDSAQVLEYWIDESLFCGWKKPLVKVPWNAEKTRADVAAYAKRGIRHFTSFAVSIDDDYVKDFGGGSLGFVKEYARVLKEEVRS